MTLPERLRDIPGGIKHADKLDAICDRWWHGLAEYEEYLEAYWPAFRFWRKHVEQEVLR